MVLPWRTRVVASSISDRDASRLTATWPAPEVAGQPRNTPKRAVKRSACGIVGLRPEQHLENESRTGQRSFPSRSRHVRNPGSNCRRSFDALPVGFCFGNLGSCVRARMPGSPVGFVRRNSKWRLLLAARGEDGRLWLVAVLLPSSRRVPPPARRVPLRRRLAAALEALRRPEKRPHPGGSRRRDPGARRSPPSRGIARRPDGADAGGPWRTSPARCGRESARGRRVVSSATSLNVDSGANSVAIEIFVAKSFPWTHGRLEIADLAWAECVRDIR